MVVQLSEDTHVHVGALGKLCFAKGLYAYVGSAQNGLGKRIERHLRGNKRMFWHVDHFLQSPVSKILKVFYETAGKAEECVIAKRIGAQGEAIVDFGCSDCHCKSHLFRVEAYDFLRDFMQEYEVPTLSASS